MHPSSVPCPSGLAHCPTPCPCGGYRPDKPRHRCRGGSWSTVEVTIRPSVPRGWRLGHASIPASTRHPCPCGWRRSLPHTVVLRIGSPFPCGPGSTKSCCGCFRGSSAAMPLRVPRWFSSSSYGSRTPAATETWSLPPIPCNEVSGDILVHGPASPDRSACTTHSSMSGPGWIYSFGYGNRIHRCFPDFDHFDWSPGGCCEASSRAMARSGPWWRIVEAAADTPWCMATFRRVGALAGVSAVPGAITVTAHAPVAIAAPHGHRSRLGDASSPRGHAVTCIRDQSSPWSYGPA